ncbi:GatB/YqeY domain-containing protein [Candidatus Formimonas warabiya]|uniref:GatB/YqeY domain-containing protein n=1 Tax=Formimonas warabiya TaxID=1761012 RepID=A0A3G1KWP3_FORW1|nr:GatB/YqeY domain-containing protein [Candidatus Formimonas warabiya]ATW26840.1 hypothetical protein DCMF_20595 [Candidatus Formimonas warabiya]
MTILMKIKGDLLEARKSDHPVKKNLISTLYAETAMLGKNKGNRPVEEITDEETLAVIKKFIKGAEESYQISLANNRQDKAALAQEELDILKAYLPAQLSEEFLEQFVKDFLERSPQKGKQVIGLIMKELNQHYQGQFDGRKANEIISRLI